uniref:Transposase Tc1-like domain-containing protein n=1 Tax=Seriola dumerili TaxID=41447 RepID=A0A3B4V6T2_SERDU
VMQGEGLSQHQAMAKLSVSRGTVHGTLKRSAETGSLVSKARSGRPKVTTPSEDQYIKLSSLRDRKATLSQIQKLLNKECKSSISKTTVKRRLSCGGLRGVHFAVDEWEKVLFIEPKF